MNNIELYYFIGDCLTLYSLPDRVERVRSKIRNAEIDWEQFTWVTSNHLVIPAVYINLEQSGLLSELPEELSAHFKHITDLNRQRNQNILLEIKEISELLAEHEVRPIFLKGCAHLLDGLYQDIGERMIGDIDLLVDPMQMKRTAEILIENGYVPLRIYGDDILMTLKHYPRLANESKIAAVEVHQHVLREKWEKSFGFFNIDPSKKEIRIYKNTFVPSTENLILHNILNSQLNDECYKKFGMHFRQMYDLFLLSLKRNPLETSLEYGKHFKVLNANLRIASEFMGDPPSLNFENSRKSERFIRKFFFFQKHARLYRVIFGARYLFLRLNNYFVQLVQSFYKPHVRKRNLAKLSNPKWYIAHIKSYRKF